MILNLVKRLLNLLGKKVVLSYDSLGYIFDQM